MSLRFEDLGLTPPVLRALDAMGYERPTPVQAEAIPPMLQGQDVLVQAPTGTGKTAAFGCAIVERIEPGRGVQALVLVPTRELCEQVADEVAAIAAGRKLRVARIYGGVSYNPQRQALADGSEIVVATPGRAIDLMKQRTLGLGGVSVVALDEADRMLDMGFEEDVRYMLDRVPNNAQHLLFSATIPHAIEDLVESFLWRPARITSKGIQGEARREEAVIEVGRRNKPWALARVLESEKPELAFVFCRTKATADRLARLLRSHDFSCESIHGDMTQAMRRRVMDKVRAGGVRVLVATDVLARGIDVRECDLVVNYDPPEEPDDYVHRVGRTARMGDAGKAVTFVTREEGRVVVEIEGLAGSPLKRMEVPTTGSRDRIRRVHDWEEFSDPRGMVHLRIEGVPDGAGRMDVFWDVVKGARLREDDLGDIEGRDGVYVVQVPQEIATRVVEAIRGRGLLGRKVRVEPVRPG